MVCPSSPEMGQQPFGYCMRVGATAKPRVGNDRQRLADQRFRSEVCCQSGQRRVAHIFPTEQRGQNAPDRPLAGPLWPDERNSFWCLVSAVSSSPNSSCRVAMNVLIVGPNAARDP